MSDADYRALYADHLSVSNWRAWMRCPAAKYAKHHGKWQEPPKDPQKDPLLVGIFAHVAMLEPDKLDAWIAEHPEILLKTGKPGEEYQKALAIVNRILADPNSELVLAGHHELPITGIINGVKWCAKIDVANEINRLFFDFKTAESFMKEKWEANEGGGGTHIKWYEQYMPQLAITKELLQQNLPGVEGDEPWQGMLFGGTKQKPPAIGLWCFDEYKIAAALSKVIETQDQIVAWRDGKETPPQCGKLDDCAYCREHSSLSIRKAV